MKWILKFVFFFLLVTQIFFAQWYQQNSGTTISLNAVIFIDTENGWIVGDGGTIIHTNDGGTTWLQQTSGTVNSLNDICFLNSKTGFAVGDGGTIIKTMDGGIHWSLLTSRTDYNLNGVSFIDTSLGWIVGAKIYTTDSASSVIIRTTNGGVVWVQQVYSDSGWLNDVCFVDSSNGWAVGGWGMILNTTNSGNSWLYQQSEAGSSLEAVSFLDLNFGWVVGGWPLRGEGKAEIIRTIDGGYSWIKNPEDSSIQYLRGVSILENNIGYAVGGLHWPGSGAGIDYILCTTNGGISWKRQLEEYGDVVLQDVCSIDVNTGWAVGTLGTILHTTNGGVSFVEEEANAEVPADFILLQNYPNPFNPDTKIKYSIPQSLQVQIKVFDVLGNEIETLVNEEKPAGTYEITWNAAHLPSGVYFYQLFVSALQSKDKKAWSFVESKKMLFLK